MQKEGKESSVGRPSKLVPSVTKKLLEAIRQGLPIVTACTLAGIAEKTYYNWLEEAQKPEADEEFLQFLQSLKKAEAEAEYLLVKEIKLADEWQAKAWILERRFGDRWKKVERNEITGKDGKPVETSNVHTTVTDVVKAVRKEQQGGQQHERGADTADS